MKLDNEIVELFRKVYSSKFNEPIDYEKAELDLKGIAYLIRITSDGAELHAHA